MATGEVNEARIKAIVEFVKMVTDGIEKLDMPAHEMMVFVEGIVRWCANKAEMHPVEFMSYIAEAVTVTELLDKLVDDIEDKSLWVRIFGGCDE